MKCKNYLLSLLENIPLWYEDVQLGEIKKKSGLVYLVLAEDFRGFSTGRL